MLDKLKKITRKLRHRPLHKPDIQKDFILLGSKYGNWPLLSETAKGSVIYSFGIGTDISFDLAAIEKFKCRILAFDPTPTSMTWLEKQSLPKEFEFHPIGLAGKDGEIEFFAPEKSEHVSFSAGRSNTGSSEANKRNITAKVLRLESIISELGDVAPDILKMDIEGFEYEVITDILEGSIRPKLFLVEFHHGMYDIPKEKTQKAVESLKAAGYALYYVSDTGHEYGFVLEK